MAKVLRHILAVLCLLAAVFFLLPLGIGILHFGMVWPAALLLLCAAWLTWPDFFRRLLRPKWLRALVGCVIAVCMTAILVTLGKMAIAAADRPADGQDCTVVVLGCQVFPDGHPSLMLRGRINAAYDYLTAHPDALCIASGGQNGSEPISEAQCIRDTLVSMGIGISGAIGSSNQLIPILSLVIGAVIGELLHIEDGVTRAGDWLQKKFGKMGPITDGFVSGSLVFAVGAMAVMGSLDSGLKNDHGILLAKSVIDFAGSVAFASSMGIGIVFSGLSVLAVEGMMTLLASLLTGVLTDAVITEISVTGSLMIIGITLNVLGVTKLRILNMTPALLLPVLLCKFM